MHTYHASLQQQERVASPSLLKPDFIEKLKHLATSGTNALEEGEVEEGEVLEEDDDDVKIVAPPPASKAKVAEAPQQQQQQPPPAAATKPLATAPAPSASATSLSSSTAASTNNSIKNLPASASDATATTAANDVKKDVSKMAANLSSFAKRLLVPRAPQQVSL